MFVMGSVSTDVMLARRDSFARKMRVCSRKVPAFSHWSPTSAIAAPASSTGLKIDSAELKEMTPLKKVFTVLVMTVSSLANGGIMGGLFGFVSGGWTTRTVAGAWTNAKTNALSLGGLSAAYTGLQTLAKVIRMKDDKYNNVLGACGSGALFSASSGPQAAIRGCASFALFSYVIESFLVQPDSRSDEEKFLSGN